jgi:hypothetical protein
MTTAQMTSGGCHLGVLSSWVLSSGMFSLGGVVIWGVVI